MFDGTRSSVVPGDVALAAQSCAMVVAPPPQRTSCGPDDIVMAPFSPIPGSTARYALATIVNHRQDGQIDLKFAPETIHYAETELGTTFAVANTVVHRVDRATVDHTFQVGDAVFAVYYSSGHRRWYHATVKDSITCGVSSQCVFPFVYDGKIYTTCTEADSKDRPWCATTANYDIDGKYKYCKDFNKTCPDDAARFIEIAWPDGDTSQTLHGNWNLYTRHPGNCGTSTEATTTSTTTTIPETTTTTTTTKTTTTTTTVTTPTPAIDTTGSTFKCSLQCINGGTCVLIKNNCSDITAPFDTPVCDCGAPAADTCFYGARCDSKIICNSLFEAQAKSCNAFVPQGRGGVDSRDVCHTATIAPSLCTAAADADKKSGSGVLVGSGIPTVSSTTATEDVGASRTGMSTDTTTAIIIAAVLILLCLATVGVLTLHRRRKAAKHGELLSSANNAQALSTPQPTPGVADSGADINTYAVPIDVNISRRSSMAEDDYNYHEVLQQPNVDTYTELDSTLPRLPELSQAPSVHMYETLKHDGLAVPG